MENIISPTIVAFSGHRPPKIGGFLIPNPIYEKIYQNTIEELHKLSPEKAICGMALGYDQLCAWACMELSIPFIAAIPFEGQEKAWPEESQAKFRALRQAAQSVKIVSPGGYAAWKMQVRNEWMVDNSTHLICCWDGSSGGTSNCVKYAIKCQKPVINVL